MSTPSELDWRTLPLMGTSLIEASAGTGKTYNIALLYLRLVLERELDVRQILVTTFTDAAAQELRARIRARLLDAENALSAAQIADSDLALFLNAMCEHKGKGTVLTRVRLALADIDLAPISTIHGFCRRVLTDFPFDTGVSFKLGEIVDEVSLVRECVQDFWRLRFLRTRIDPWDAGFVLDAGIDAFAQIVRAILAMDEAAIDIDPTAPLRTWWDQFCAQDHSKLLKDLTIEAAFNKRNTGFRGGLHALIKAAAAGDPGAVNWADLFVRLHPDAVYGAGIKGYSPHMSTWETITPLIDARPLFERAASRICHEVAIECAGFVRTELRKRLLARGQTTFHQLIDEVHQRLMGAAAATLATRLQQSWPAALIDEFQDTDARQWAIFNRVWNSPESDGRALILIGDPKQSIYGFRGGDVHSYLAVRESLHPSRVHSISRNFRSQPNLLSALNGVYARAADAAFAQSGIDYVPVFAGHPEDWSETATAQPLRLCVIKSPGPTKPQRDRAALARCADDIAALLNDAKSGFQPGDIAVLLDTNKRIGELRAELIARGVPVVGAGRANVLEGEWAQEIQLLLYALLHISDEYALRGALATRLLGATVVDLLRLADDTAAWELQLKWFLDQRLRWEKQGPLAVIETIIAAQAPRLLAAADGERVLTDLRHLGELLQEASASCYGPDELYAWFVTERVENSGDVEAGRDRQLRIESETARVQLLTIHASKGLQYPAVFVPMAWRDKKPMALGRARYHSDRFELRLDLGTSDFDRHESQSLQEDLQERMRHLYVALTRAERCCVIYTFDSIPAPSGEHSERMRGALDVLLSAALHAPDNADASPFDGLREAVKTLFVDDSEAAFTRFERVTQRPSRRLARAPLPRARHFVGLHSFTSLTRVRHATATEFNRGAEDELALVETEYPEASDASPPHPRLLALSTLKGPRFGTAIHELLEVALDDRNLPHSSGDRFAAHTDSIRHALDRQSVRLSPHEAEQQLAAVADVLDRTLDTELAPGLQLGALEANARRPEFEFAFVLEHAHWSQLHQILQTHDLAHWWPHVGTAQVLNGLMQGSLDLVFQWQGRFHVLDYKANWLGDQLSDYSEKSMDRAMEKHHYGLQALIYTVALHRYLASRIDDYDPQRHLGDSWYLFVRAVGLSADAGIWRKRFAQSLLDALDALFNGQEIAICA